LKALTHKENARKSTDFSGFEKLAR